jgi:hypothetical protein
MEPLGTRLHLISLSSNSQDQRHTQRQTVVDQQYINFILTYGKNLLLSLLLEFDPAQCRQAHNQLEIKSVSNSSHTKRLLLMHKTNFPSFLPVSRFSIQSTRKDDLYSSQRQSANAKMLALMNCKGLVQELLLECQCKMFGQ